MTPAKKPAKGKTTARKASAKSAAAKKTTAKKAASKKATAKKTAARNVKKTAKKTTAKKTAAKKTTAKKKTAKKTAKKTTQPKRTAATKATTGTRGRQAKPGTAKQVAAKAPSGKGKAAAAEAAVKKMPPPSRPFTRPMPAAPPKRKVRPAKFDKDQLKKIRAGLEGKRAELEARMAELEADTFDATQSDQTGEVGLDEDFADAGTATFERERDLSIRNNIRDLIDQMNRAIGRIDDGVYGACERCGQPIDAARLRELPHSSLCLDCKRREERAR